MHAQATCKAVSFLLMNTSYGRHYIQSTDFVGPLAIFRGEASAIVPEMKELCQFIVDAMLGYSTTIDEFNVKAMELGKSICSHFHVISTMKRHWMIAHMAFGWLRSGNEGQITIILPSMDSMWAVDTLLRKIGIHVDALKHYRVEQQMQSISRKHKKGKRGRQRMCSTLIFKMTIMKPMAGIRAVDCVGFLNAERMRIKWNDMKSSSRSNIQNNSVVN